MVTAIHSTEEESLDGDGGFTTTLRLRGGQVLVIDNIIISTRSTSNYHSNTFQYSVSGSTHLLTARTVYLAYLLLETKIK